MKKLSIILIMTACLAFTGCADFLEDYETDSGSSVVTETLPETTAELTTEPEPEEDTTVPETSEESAEPETSAESLTEPDEIFNDYDDDIYIEYHFRTSKQLEQHFEKHGGEFEDSFDYDSAEEYEAGASDVINNPDALYKTEAEDGDGVYYIESTNEFVILSTDGYIRTYFRPTAGIDYFNRQ